MAVPTGPQRRISSFAWFALWAVGGITAWVMIAMFAAHGQVHAFALGAFATGMGLGVLAALGRWLSGVRWREVIGLAALSALLGTIFERW